MQAVREYRLLVRPSIVVRVFEHDQLVVRTLIAGTIVRVRRDNRHPETSFVVEGHLHGIAKIGKLAFRGEEVDFVTLRQCELIQRLVDVEKVDLTIVVGDDFAELARRAIVDRLAGRATLRHVVNLIVPQLGHLADLLDLFRVVDVAVGLVATSVNVNAIENAVVVQPIPVLVFDNAVHVLAGDLLLSSHFAVERLNEDLRQILVALIRQREAVDRLGILLFGIKFLGRLEEIHVSNITFVRYALDSASVGFQTDILFLAIRQVLLTGKILEGRWRNEHQPRSGLAIVLLLERVLNEGIQFRLEIVQLLHSPERFVVAEEREDRIRLKLSQPFVRRGEVTNAEVGLLVGVEFLGSWKSPLRFPRRVGTKSGGFARTRDIANDQFLVRKLAMQIGLEMRKVEHALP